jgi:16S rRNA (cytidine1402-2'-O)-methyltransferase
MDKGKLFLIPVDLMPGESAGWVGARLREAVQPLRQFVVEHPKPARQFLKVLDLPLQELTLEILDEHSKPEDVRRLAQKLGAGHDLGLLSEAGCPAIADPGAALVAEAHRIGASVVPLVGPCSIILALMASGFNGQRFTFNGYLPTRSPERENAIRELEERSRRRDETQIFIEAPYRNDQLFGALLATCSPHTLLCVATDLTGATEEVKTVSAERWKNQPPNLDRRPTVFLLSAKKPTSAQRGNRPRGTH